MYSNIHDCTIVIVLLLCNIYIVMSTFILLCQHLYYYVNIYIVMSTYILLYQHIYLNFNIYL